MTRSSVIFWVLLVLGMSGCRSTSTFVGAVACQGLSRPAKSGSPEQWAFRGLDVRVPPRIRPGSYPTADHAVGFIGPEDLGPHRYWLDAAEGNGILYTCHAGHIDIAHVRKAADWTGFLAALTFEHLRRHQTTFVCKSREPSRYFVELTYPRDWDSRSVAEKERVARDVSRQLGQYLAYTAMTWHEMLTWFDFRPKGYESDRQSAFSWEDSYSNLLGTCVGAAALQDQDHTFSDAVTQVLREHLESLGPQPAAVSRQASEAVRGDWYSARWFSPVIRKRNFDIGLDDGQVTPCLLPSVSACADAEACSLTAPTLDGLARYGFSVAVKIEPRVWEQDKIFKALYGNRKPATKTLDPSIHFALLIDHMKRAGSH